MPSLPAERCFTSSLAKGAGCGQNGMGQCQPSVRLGATGRQAWGSFSHLSGTVTPSWRPSGTPHPLNPKVQLSGQRVQEGELGQPSTDPLLRLSPHLCDTALGLGWGPCWGGGGGLWVFLLLKPKLLKLRKFLARLSGASNKLFITGCKRSQLRGPGLRSRDSESATQNLPHTSLETHIHMSTGHPTGHRSRPITHQ